MGKSGVAEVALNPEIESTVDLEIGVQVLPEIEVAGVVKPETRKKAKTWIDRAYEPDSPHSAVWMNISKVSYLITIPLYGFLDDPDNFWYNHMSIPLMFVYCFLLACASFGRDPIPYTLRRSQKQLLESAFVVACSCWTYSFRDFSIVAIIIGLVLLFNFIPLLNLWWSFANIGYYDCCLIIAIDVALVCFRNQGGVAFAVVSGTCVVFQLIKDPFCRFCCSMKTKLLGGEGETCDQNSMKTKLLGGEGETCDLI